MFSPFYILQCIANLLTNIPKFNTYLIIDFIILVTSKQDPKTRNVTCNVFFVIEIVFSREFSQCVKWLFKQNRNVLFNYDPSLIRSWTYIQIYKHYWGSSNNYLREKEEESWWSVESQRLVMCKLGNQLMGDNIGSGSVTDCLLRPFSDLKGHTQQCSAELHYGKNQNKPNPNRCHRPLITQLSHVNKGQVVCKMSTIFNLRGVRW